ncbi:MAG: hypothetical protein U9N56_02555 [Actinomycetota bacterium]|nr:hypothetical protein [Actinomycetota bacterium]
MRRKTLSLLVILALTLAACGSGSEVTRPSDPDAPLLQVRTEGGFAPVEFVLGSGPTYTLLAGGRLIHTGPTIAIYPGPLLPNYLVSQINDDQMNTILELIDRIGLPDMENDIPAFFVGDGTIEVITYWDSEGEHSSSVYALGVEPDSSTPFTELFVMLDQFAAEGEAVAYQSDRVRVIAGVGFTNPDSSDVRDWPLDNADFSRTTVLCGFTTRDA